jgi:hypothetical protein
MPPLSFSFHHARLPWFSRAPCIKSTLKVRTVAWHEEFEELEVMRQIGCDAGQGCLFQRPVTPEDFTAFLREWPRRSVTRVCVSGGPGVGAAPGARVHGLHSL